MGGPVIRLRLLLDGHGVVQLILQLGNFERGQQLVRLNLVAEINLHLADIAGDLRVQFHLLVGPELGGHGHLIKEGLARHLRHGYGNGLALGLHSGLGGRAEDDDTPHG